MRAIVNLILLSSSVLVSHCSFEEGSQTKSDTSEEAGPSSDPMVLKYVKHFENGKSSTDFNMNGITYLANMLGYGWAGGCPFGTGFTNDVWRAKQITSNLKNCEGHGYDDGNRASYELYDFRNDYVSLKFGAARPVGDVQIKTRTSFTVTNRTELSVLARMKHSEQHKNITTTTRSTQIGTTIGTSISNEVRNDIQVDLGAVKAGTSWSTKVDFSAQVSKSISNGSSDSQWDGVTKEVDLSAELPACSAVDFVILTKIQDYVMPWDAKVKTTSSLRIKGWLRHEWHGHTSHGKNRPKFDYEVGARGLSIGEALLYQMDNNNLVWNWDDIKRQNGEKFDFWREYAEANPNLYYTMTDITGRTELKEQLDIYGYTENLRMLDPSECGSNGEVSGSGQKDTRSNWEFEPLAKNPVTPSVQPPARMACHWYDQFSKVWREYPGIPEDKCIQMNQCESIATSNGSNACYSWRAVTTK